MSLASNISDLAATIANYLRDAVLPRTLPAGGSAGQVLAKTSVTDYDTQWVTTDTYTTDEIDDLFLPVHSEISGLYGAVSSLTPESVGLGDVDNTSDENKPLSLASRDALDGKAALVHNHDELYQPLGAGGGTPAGNTKEVQYNNDGAFDGAANVEIDNGDLCLVVNAAPVVPPAGNVKVFGRSVAGRLFPAFVGPTGQDTSIQPLIARNKIGYWCPPGNATTVPGVLGFTAPTITGFTATARNIATTNLFTRMRRLGYVTAATAGTVGNWRVGVYQYTVGGGTGLGGFTYIIRFGISDAAAVTGARMFIGMRSSSTPANVEPSTLTNCFGVGHGAADTNLKFYYGGSAAQTAIDLGAGFPLDRSTTPYELALFSQPTATSVTWQVTNLTSGATQSGTITGAATVMPQETTLIAPWGYRTNNTTALAVGLDVMSAYIETDR